MLFTDFILKTDRTPEDADGSYETTEAVENFTLDAAGYAPETFTHDAAGNFTYDGVHQYAYDAWNRQVRVTKAYRVATDDGAGGVTLGSVQLGSVVSESQYDGLNRRVVKQVENSGGLDCTYHYYYKGQSIIEVRNGSDAVIKQYVWGGASGAYIDDLVQVAVNGDPVNDPTFNPSDPDHDFRGYYAMHDANYDVEGLVDSSGGLVERYTYTPYGRRRVFFSPGANDPKDYAATLMSRRVEVAGGFGSTVTEPYGLNPFGHQGLHHDEESGLVYNRARMYSPRIGRFMQRDPLSYIDGANLYQYVRSNPLRFADVTGQALSSINPGTIGEIIEAGITAKELAQMLQIPVKVAAAMIAAHEFNKAVDQLVDRYKNQAKGKDPCDQAQNAVKQAEKAIRSLNKVIQKHQSWINNPSSYPGPVRDPTDAMRGWQRDIQRARDNIKKNQKALDKLKKAARDACRCWYKPWTW